MYASQNGFCNSLTKSLTEPKVANSVVSQSILSFLHLISELGLQISLIYLVLNLNTPQDVCTVK